MKPQITWKTLVLIFLIIFLSKNFSAPIVIGQSTIFDAKISTNKDVYYAHEEVIVSYSFSSHVTEEEYFAVGVANNISFNYFHQSEPIQGNFSVSQEYSFTLPKINYTFSGESAVIFILLYYYDALFGNEICCYTSIIIEKMNLICHGPQNNTYIVPDIINNFTFYLSNSLNASVVPIDQALVYNLYTDGFLSAQNLVYTNYNGSFMISIIPSPRVQQYNLQIKYNESTCFTSLHVIFLFITHPKDLTLRNRIAITSIIFCITALCSGGIYGCVVYYLKNIKKRYQVEKLKI